MSFSRTLVLAASLSVLSIPVAAQDKAAMASVKMRQGQMQMISANMAILGGMAKGAIAYDAETAARAASDLAAIGSLSPAVIWAEGSDNSAMEGTRALPAVWSDWDGFTADWQDFATAASAAAGAAGNGQEAIGPLLGGLGGSCKACHEGYRASAN